MQKNNKKASILLWSIMLSLIIAISFISISNNINNNIKLSGELSKFIEEKNKINLAIYYGNNYNIGENKLLIFESNKENIFSLKKNEELTLSFFGSNNFDINIEIINGGGLNYKYIKNDNSISSSGVINYSKSFTGELNNNTGSLIFKNIGGNIRFLIKSENSFETLKKNYRIVNIIGSNYFNQTKNAY